jgi:hypothetical protein
MILKTRRVHGHPLSMIHGIIHQGLEEMNSLLTLVKVLRSSSIPAVQNAPFLTGKSLL